MAAVDAMLTELRLRLQQHPADREPLQHGTAQVRLAALQAELGRAAEAVAHAAIAVDLLAMLPVEHAKAHNVLGIALRLSGRLDEADAAFRAAEAGFDAVDHEAERAASAHNLGLVAVERSDTTAAMDAFDRARRIFEGLGAHALAGAATRELGQVLLTRGEYRHAAQVLADAEETLDRSGDHAGAAAAANALGLARLACDDVDGSVDALRRAVASHPRSVRPAAYAMAKANLALALERRGEAARARLAARQARDVSAADEAVRAQARTVFARLGGDGRDDLLVVVDAEPTDGRVGVVREEVLRWLDSDGDDVRDWAVGILERRGIEADLLEVWLSVALELPPASMARLVGALVEAASTMKSEDVDRFRGAVAAASARFAGPQWDRLRTEFSSAAAAHGSCAEGWT